MTSDEIRKEARRMAVAIEGDGGVTACLERIKRYTPQQVAELAERGAERTDKQVRDGMAEIARRYRLTVE